LGPDGRRRDADMRPELARGTVEFVAPKEYMVYNSLLTLFRAFSGEAVFLYQIGYLDS